MAIGGQTNEPPEPPSVEEITDAFREILKEELAAHDAATYADVFQSAANWLVDWGRTAHSQLLAKGTEPSIGDLNDHDEVDFRAQLEGYCNPHSSFSEKLHFIKRSPEWGKFILPAFVTGLVAQLQIDRMHLLVRHLDGVRLTVDDLQALLRHVAEANEALLSSLASFKSFRDNHVKKEGVAGLTEAGDLEKMVNKIYTGKDDLGFVDKAISELGAINTGLLNEIQELAADRPLKCFWKPEWNTHKRKSSRGQGGTR